VNSVPQENGQNRSKSFQTLLISVLALVLVASVISRQISTIGQFIHDCGWLGLGLSVLLYGILGASPIPSEPLTVIITSIFGPFIAAVVATFGNVLAALVEFYIGAKVGDITNFEEKKARLPLGLNKLPVDSPVFLIVARMLPGFGPKCVSIISGVYGISLWLYIWTTFVSTLIGAIVVAFGGQELINLIRVH
jgi:uncharacterized membrane protein YdjX (TVP38/TMEM64 family)